MKIDRISYKKIFQIGSYVNETIGMEAQLDDGDHIPSCLFDLKNRVEAFHKINNPPLSDVVNTTWSTPPSIPQSIDRKAIDDLEIKIDNATSIEELSTFKDEASRLGLVDHYIGKLKQLS